MLPFILSLLAGLSTLLGTIFIFFKCDIDKLTKYSLSFASGVMFCVSMSDLIPESILLLNQTNKNTLFPILFIFILIGLTLPYFIDKIIKENNDVSDKKMYKLGMFSMIAIIIHNIPEGIATFLSSANNLSLGIMITIAITLHNIPEGISISVPVYKATKSRKKAIFLTFISGMSEPFGALLAYLFLAPFINNTLMGGILAIIAGIMLHIAMLQLLPTALKYKNKSKTILFFLIGIAFMLISHLLLK